MINALIVDDDMATVEVVRNAVHWKQLGVENVSKAYNIEQAKKILLNEPINLVISDVEMPMGSGLDLLRWFREQKMDGEFLLLTCHEDFSYASEALHNRAAEYLLKPFDVDVMEVALRRIIIRIKEQQALKKNSELGVWVKDNYDEVQLSFWNSVLEGRFEEKPQQAAQEIAKRQLALDPQADYTLIVGRLTNLAKDETRFGRDLLLFAVKNVFSELLCGRPENDSILCNDRHTEILVTAICSEGQEKLQERCILLMKQTESIMNSILTVCICNPCRVENLYSMHQEAIQALVHNVADYGTCFHLSDAQAETINGSFTLDTKKLEESVFKRDKRAILQYVKDHLEEGMKTKQLSIEALQSARQTLLQIVYASYEEKTYEKVANYGYLTYDFFLPGLLIDAIEQKDGTALAGWANELIEKHIVTVNMLGCHDGIPLLDLRGLLPEERIAGLIDLIIARGGFVKNLHGQKNVYYQVNATYYSALGEDDRKMLVARAVQLFMPGKPQVWYLDLFAGKNDHEAVAKAGEGGHKEINRTNLTVEQIHSALTQDVVKKQIELLRFRKSSRAFTSNAKISVISNKNNMHFIWQGNTTAELSVDFTTMSYEVKENGYIMMKG